MKSYFQFSAVVAIFSALLTPMAHAQMQSFAHVAETDASVEYANADFGFCAQFPAGWRDFSITTGHWSSEPPGQAHSITGPIVRIRHPQWTSRDPREDVPILVFTRAQWRSVQGGRLAVSTAPYGPRELAHNKHYVFALPPRYNADMAEGYEEVEDMVSQGFLHSRCDANARGQQRNLERAASPGSVSLAGSSLAGRQ